MTSQTHTRHLSLVLLFVFCQVIGTMCTLPELSLANVEPSLMEEETAGMTCPMNGTVMCPPSATSSQERQIKQVGSIDLDHSVGLFGAVVALTASLLPSLWSGASTCSNVPISIASSSVLRI